MFNNYLNCNIEVTVPFAGFKNFTRSSVGAIIISGVLTSANEKFITIKTYEAEEHINIDYVIKFKILN